MYLKWCGEFQDHGELHDIQLLSKELKYMYMSIVATNRKAIKVRCGIQLKLMGMLSRMIDKIRGQPR